MDKLLMKKGFCTRFHSGLLGRYPSGGCIQCQRDRLDSYYRTPDCRYTFSKRHATRRKLTWEIDKEDFVKLFSNPVCFYCEEPFKTAGTGLDRIDSSKGYTLNNVVMCCTDCNKHKFDPWTLDEAKLAIQTVKQHRKNNF